MYEIGAVVKFNSDEALVLSEKPVITYERYGNVLLGMDEYGVFLDSYVYKRPSDRFRAFGGRKFDIPMSDGSIIKADGQWWDAGHEEFEEKLGSKVLHVTAHEVKSLKSCYVFCGYLADQEEYEKLRKSYTGRVWEYWEYECELTGNCAMWNKDEKNPKNMKEGGHC